LRRPVAEHGVGPGSGLGKRKRASCQKQPNGNADTKNGFSVHQICLLSLQPVAANDPIAARIEQARFPTDREVRIRRRAPILDDPIGLVIGSEQWRPPGAIAALPSSLGY